MKPSLFELPDVEVAYKKEITGDDFIKHLRDEERVLEIKSVLKVIANSMAMPLYLLFWIADIVYVPHLKWEFLIVRLGIIPLSLLIQYLVGRARTFYQAQCVALLFNVGMATAINYMIFRIGDSATSYYAGLNLVALGNLAFIPWNLRFYVLVTSLIFGPYYLITLFLAKNGHDLQGLFLNSFFIVSTIIMLFLIRLFNEAVRKREFASRLALKEEIDSRDEVIQRKTSEAVNLSALSRQFSPQIVEAIRTDKIDLKGQVHRSQICAIFVDIVNSTERVNRIDKDKFDKVISRFMEDSIKIMLKYDITIDKFLGDGILAFSNDPVRHKNYVERVLNAAIELRLKVRSHQEFYENHWKNEFQIRIGIAVGFANVGFYGNEQYFRSYTAIGPVINLASRLCGSADPNQIIIDHDVFELADSQNYKTKLIGKKTLKGFEADIIKTYELIEATQNENLPMGVYDCPTCKTVLGLETDDNGIFIFKCRTCSYVLSDSNSISGAGKAA